MFGFFLKSNQEGRVIFYVPHKVLIIERFFWDLSIIEKNISEFLVFIKKNKNMFLKVSSNIYKVDII
jgi:hypothetical protein